MSLISNTSLDDDEQGRRCPVMTGSSYLVLSLSIEHCLSVKKKKEDLDGTPTEGQLVVAARKERIFDRF
jgi:magnesium-transporting ATPase (P-type)